MKAVYIEWVDSATYKGWVEGDDGPSSIKTIGWLVNNKKDYVVVSTSDSDSGHILDPLVIPRVAIKKLRYIKV